MTSSPRRGRRLQIDHTAESGEPTLPAFLARPAGSPVYHGFAVTDVVWDGFTLGLVSGLDPGDECGDAFVIAPDGSRAGLVWEHVDGTTDVLAEPVCPFTADRWGVWAVALPCSMASRTGQERNLELLVAQLRNHWAEWKQQYRVVE